MMQIHIGIMYNKLYCLHILFSVIADVHFSADADVQADPADADVQADPQGCAWTEPELSTPGDPEVVR